MQETSAVSTTSSPRAGSGRRYPNAFREWVVEIGRRLAAHEGPIFWVQTERPLFEVFRVTKSGVATSYRLDRWD